MRVVLTGGKGMLGSALFDAWCRQRPEDKIIPITRDDVDLCDHLATYELFASLKPDLVLHAAAKVGGIAANIAAPAAYLVENLSIDLNVIGAAHASGARNLIYFGSSCMYPRDYRQPLVETDLLQAPLEPTNEGYALAKIVGAKHCEYLSRQFDLNYRVLIPSNLYGPNDHYGSSTSHLVAAAIYKVHLAKLGGEDYVEVWGDGTARREFTYVGDVAEWVAQSAESLQEWPLMMNIGLGTDYSIREYYEFALSAVGYECELRFDHTKPAGMRQKLMDSSTAAFFGWAPQTSASDGMRRAYELFSASLKSSS